MNNEYYMISDEAMEIISPLAEIELEQSTFYNQLAVTANRLGFLMAQKYFNQEGGLVSYLGKFGPVNNETSFLSFIILIIVDSHKSFIKTSSSINVNISPIDSFAPLCLPVNNPGISS